MAAANKRRKKLTNTEKNYRKQVKKNLQEKGLLPPDKKPLNRRKFALEVLKAVHGDDFNFYEDLPHIMKAFSWMVPYYHEEKMQRRITPEQIGALKVLKIAMEMKAFWLKKHEAGISEVNGMEFYQTVIKPIIDL